MPSHTPRARRLALCPGHTSVLCLLLLACGDEPSAQRQAENSPTSETPATGEQATSEQATSEQATSEQATSEQGAASEPSDATALADAAGQPPAENSQATAAGSDQPASDQGTGPSSATADTMTGSASGDEGNGASGATDPVGTATEAPNSDDPAGAPGDADPVNPDPAVQDPAEEAPAPDETPPGDDTQAQPSEPTDDDPTEPEADPGEGETEEPDPSDPTDDDAGACEGNADPDFSLVGWAAEAGGTTGGQGGSVVSVGTGAELQQAIEDHQDSSGALTIMVNGTITEANSGVEKIDVKDVANLSIIGAGTGAEFDGIGIKIVRANNIIVRNLKIHHVDIGDKDCISIEGPAHHIWIDHNELWNEYDESVDKDYYDGLLDVKSEAEYITYSWNYLHDSWKTSLVGSSESDTFDRKLTIHHNYFRNCNSRLPLFRGGNGHIFSNLFEDIADTTINSRIGACIRVENNVFINAQNPWVSAYSDELGAAELICNSLEDSPFVYSDDVRELPACTANVPYAYGSALTETSSVAEMVRAHAGAGKLADPTQL